MAARKYHLHDGRKGAAIAVRVTPRARRNEIVGIMRNGTIKIRLVAPPVEGKANAALIKFLADLVGVAQSRIDIVAGASGRDKLVSVMDMDTETLHQRILEHMK
jgi:uncharacterized protein (TIGR00251 family)